MRSIAVAGTPTNNRSSYNRICALVRGLLSPLRGGAVAIFTAEATQGVGAEWAARMYCARHNIDYFSTPTFWFKPDVHPTDATKDFSNPYNPATDPDAARQRNAVLARMCDELYAFWDGADTHTSSVINSFKDLGKPVHIIPVQL